MARRVWVDEFRQLEKFLFAIPTGKYREALGKKLKELQHNYNSDFHDLHIDALNQGLASYLATPVQPGDFSNRNKLIEVRRKVEARIKAQFLTVLLGLPLVAGVLGLSSAESLASEGTEIPVKIASIDRKAQLIEIVLDAPFLTPKADERDCESYGDEAPKLLDNNTTDLVRSCSMAVTVDEEPYIEKIHIQTGTLDPKKTYILSTPDWTDNDGHIVKRSFRVLNPRELTVRLGRDARELQLESSAPLRPCSPPNPEDCASQYAVTIKRGQIEQKVESVVTTTEAARTMYLRLPLSVRDGDKISVATTDDVGAIFGSTIVERQKAKTMDAAQTYVSLALERDHEVSDRTVGIVDVKYNQDFFPELGASWIGPSIALRLDWDNKDSNSEKKLDIDVSWRRRFFALKNGRIDPGKTSVNAVFGPGLEFEDDFDNRNALISAVGNLDNHSWCGRLSCSPKLGLEVGQNFGLSREIDPDSNIESFDIMRVLAGVQVSYRTKLTDSSLIKGVSFSASASTRYLLTDEIERTRIESASEDADVAIVSSLNDGLRSFWQVEAILDLGDRLGFSLKHEEGERPPFYLDNSKTTAAIVYSF